MVSWTCEKCNGRGTQEVIEIRGGEVTKRDERCSNCNGCGSMRNGKPEY